MKLCNRRSIINYNEITRKSYELTAQEYDEHTSKIPTEMKAQGFISRLQPPAKILDVGCGSGRDAKFFTDQGFEVTGIDFSKEMVRLSSRLVPKGDFQVMDIENIDFPEKSFDAIWASASLLHISKSSLPGILKTFKKLLKKNGLLYVSLKKGEGEILEPDRRYGGVEKFWSYYQEQELRDYLEKGGFSVLECRTFEKSTSYQTHPWISIIAKV